MCVSILQSPTGRGFQGPASNGDCPSYVPCLAYHLVSRMPSECATWLTTISPAKLTMRTTPMSAHESRAHAAMSTSAPRTKSSWSNGIHDCPGAMASRRFTKLLARSPPMLPTPRRIPTTAQCAYGTSEPAQATAACAPVAATATAIAPSTPTTVLWPPSHRLEMGGFHSMPKARERRRHIREIRGRHEVQQLHQPIEKAVSHVPVMTCRLRTRRDSPRRTAWDGLRTCPIALLINTPSLLCAVAAPGLAFTWPNRAPHSIKGLSWHGPSVGECGAQRRPAPDGA